MLIETRSLKTLVLESDRPIGGSSGYPKVLWYLPKFYDALDDDVIAPFAGILGLDPERFKAFYVGAGKYVCTGCSRTAFRPMFNARDLNPLGSKKKSGKTRARVMEKLKWLGSKGADYALSITPTFPKEYSMSNYGNTKRHVEIIKNFIKKVEAAGLFGMFGKMGGFFFIHKWSSREPFSPHVHGHLTIPNLRRISLCQSVLKGKAKILQSRFIRFQPYLSDSSLGLLRSCWKEALEEAGVQVDGNVDVHFGYRQLPTPALKSVSNKKYEKAAAKLIHWVDYTSRKASLDVWNELSRDDADVSLSMLQGNYYDLDFVRYVLEYDNRCYNFGFFYNLKKSGYASAKVKGELYCLICNSPLEFIEYINDIAEIPVNVACIQQRRYGIVAVPPPDYLKC